MPEIRRDGREIRADRAPAEVREGRVTLAGYVEFGTNFLTERHGCSPIGRTFEFEVTHSGTIYRYSGVPCVVDGESTSFRLDEAVLLSTFRAPS